MKVVCMFLCNKLVVRLHYCSCNAGAHAGAHTTHSHKAAMYCHTEAYKQTLQGQI